MQLSYPLSVQFKLQTRGVSDTVWTQLSTSLCITVPNSKNIFSHRVKLSGRVCSPIKDDSNESSRRRDDWWLTVSPRWAHISTPTNLWDTGSQENGRKELCQDTLDFGKWGHWVWGLCCINREWVSSSYCHIITSWYSFRVSFRCFLWSKCNQQ